MPEQVKLGYLACFNNLFNWGRLLEILLVATVLIESKVPASYSTSSKPASCFKMPVKIGNFNCVSHNRYCVNCNTVPTALDRLTAVIMSSQITPDFLVFHASLEE